MLALQVMAPCWLSQYSVLLAPHHLLPMLADLLTRWLQQHSMKAAVLAGQPARTLVRIVTAERLQSESIHKVVLTALTRARQQPADELSREADDGGTVQRFSPLRDNSRSIRREQDTSKAITVVSTVSEHACEFLTMTQEPV